MLADIKINLHPVNFIILSGLLQCVILSAILLYYKGGKRTSNCLIGSFILLCSLHFLWSMVIDTNLGDIFKQLYWFPYSFLLALGPLIYLYTKSLTQDVIKFDSSTMIHFIPVGVELAAHVYFISQSISVGKVPYVEIGRAHV